MATFFERIVNPPSSPTGPEEEKIPVDALREVMREYHGGFFAGQEVIAAFNLNASQQADAVTLYSAIVASSNRVAFFNMLFSFLALGEMGYKPSYYRSEPAFWGRVGSQG